MKDLRLICAQPNDEVYFWQVCTWLDSARQFGYSDKCEVLLFCPKDRKGIWPSVWDTLEGVFPEVKFFRYEDEHNIYNLQLQYRSIIRPYVLWKHWKAYPELRDCTIFYHDCDIILTGNIDFEKFSDDKCYLSDAKSYTNADYFLRKEKDALEEKKDGYPDILAELEQLSGLEPGTILKNNDNSGGAQYILNGIDNTFWSEMIGLCMGIYSSLGVINQKHFESENKGFQRWCSDMFAMMWLMWKRGIQTVVPKELDFAWSTDRISKLEKVSILHNAGIDQSSQVTFALDGQTVTAPVFYKGRYVPNKTPYTDSAYTSNILNNEYSKNLCNHYYLTKTMEAGIKYNFVNTK